MRSNRLTGVILGAIFLSGAIVTVSRAQPRAMPPDPYDPNASATQPQSTSQSAAAPQADVELSKYQGPTDYPAAAVQAVPVAHARATVAKALYDRARSSLY